jgi:hypothetical protein
MLSLGGKCDLLRALGIRGHDLRLLGSELLPFHFMEPFAPVRERHAADRGACNAQPPQAVTLAVQRWLRAQGPLPAIEIEQ